MNAYLRFDGIELWQLAGWTMLHFLWLGTLVGLVAGTLRLLLRRTSPNIRYITATLALTVLALLPLGIAAWLSTTYPADFAAKATLEGHAPPIQVAPPIQQSTDQIIELAGRSELPQETAPSGPTLLQLPSSPDRADSSSPNLVSEMKTEDIPAVTEHAAVAASATRSSRYGALIEPLHSCALYLPWVWFIGTPITFAYLATGIVGTRRLRYACRPIHDGPIAEMFTQLAASLRIGKRVGLAVCDRIATPVLIGIVRPIILLPPAALTGWSPDEIEMVLLHELAHVRRWDNLVNLAQRIVESLLFFHPVVWLVSNWIRREREACCDALVVDRTKRPHAYAELLVALAAELPRSVLFQPAASSAMASGPLRNRVRRILQLEDDPMLVSGTSFGLVLGSLLLAATLALLYVPSIGQAEESKEAKESFTEETNVTKTMGAKAESNEQTDELTTDVLQIDTPNGQAVLEADDEPGRIRTRSNDATASGTPPDTGTQPAPPSPLDDNRPAPPGMTFPWEQETPGKPTDDDREENTFVAYNVSRELIRPLENWVKFMKVKGYSDKPDRFVMQAPNRVHEQLQALLDATKRWQSPSEILERGPNTFVKFEKEGQPRLNWRTMGLTLGAARAVDQPSKRPPRVIGPEVIAVEPGSPAAWLTIEPGDTLTHVSNFEIRGLMSLESMIKTMLDASTRVRHTITFVKADGTRLAAYLPQIETDRAKTSVDDRYEEVKSSDGPHGANIASHSSKFPSLEDQKLADLAFKRLGLELESITEVDLNRVKALDYDGGVKVAAGWAGVVSGAGFAENSALIQMGDILVGLHVWPTTNMEQVAEVLSREDLAELNPLKFYVVRRDPSAQSRGVKPSPVAQGPTRQDRDDIVITGRVTVNLFGGSFRRASTTFAPPSPTSTFNARADEPALQVHFFHSADSLPAKRMKSVVEKVTRQFGDVMLHVVDVSTEAATANAFDIVRIPTLVLVRDGEVVQRLVGTQTEKQLHDAINAALSTWTQSPVAQPGNRRPAVIEGNPPTSSPPDPSSLTDSEIPRYVLPSPGEEDQLPKWPHQKIPGIETAPNSKHSPRSAVSPGRTTPQASVEVEQVPRDGERTLIVRGPADAVREGTSAKENLRYEGKTFDEWRDASRIELSTQRQTEAVHALAAFGANGYAREATDAILDMAAKHDFRTRSSPESPESALKSAIIGSFTWRRTIDKSISFPMIIQRYDSSPDIWHDFLVRVLSGSSNLPSSVIALIRPLLEHERPDLRAAALEPIYQSNPAGSAELLANALRDPDPQVITKGLHLIGDSESRLRRDPTSPKINFPMEQFLELVFRADSGRSDQIRDQARGMLSANNLSDETLGQILARLAEILNDPARNDEHVVVIRAMREMARRLRATNRDSILDPVTPILEHIFMESKDVQLRVAAAYALDMIDRQVLRMNQLMTEANDLPRDEREQMRQLIDAEDEMRW